MKAPGPLLAAGRDCDIYEYGPGLVMRQSRKGRSQALEARAMEYVRSHGYPVPAIEEVSEDGLTVVMQRIEGATMVEVLRRRPWTVRHQGRTLGHLHRRLHEIPGPDWLPEGPVAPGDRLVHLDLHPLNVMLGPGGPVVIDWTGAGRGEPGVDVALAWALMSAGQIPGRRVEAALMGLGRSQFTGAFLREAGRDAAVRVLAEVVEWKCGDANMSDAERAGMRQLAESVTGRPGLQ